jgi:hypothetical protein
MRQALRYKLRPMLTRRVNNTDANIGAR